MRHSAVAKLVLTTFLAIAAWVSQSPGREAAGISAPQAPAVGVKSEGYVVGQRYQQQNQWQQQQLQQQRQQQQQQQQLQQQRIQQQQLQQERLRQQQLQQQRMQQQQQAMRQRLEQQRIQMQRLQQQRMQQMQAQRQRLLERQAQQQRQTQSRQQDQLRQQQQRGDAKKRTDGPSKGTDLAVLAATAVPARLQGRLASLSESIPKLKTDAQHRRDLQRAGKLGTAAPGAGAGGNNSGGGGGSPPEKPLREEFRKQAGKTGGDSARPIARISGSLKAKLAKLSPAPKKVAAPSASLPVPPDLPKHIHADAQGKHVPGHRNYNPNNDRSVLHESAEQLLSGVHSGQYKILRMAGSKPIVDFGRPIGKYGKNGPTTQYGIIHYGKNGAHIVPANPSQE